MENFNFYITFNFSTFMWGNTEIERLKINENEYFTACGPCRQEGSETTQKTGEWVCSGTLW